jgi:putative tryptophan/tyrosine transport system substrate-binding protein
MRRRHFAILVGLGSLMRHRAASAQAMPVVGFISGASAEGYAPMLATFRKGLAEAGWFEGRNLTLLVRWAEERPEQLQAMLSELVQLPVAVIAATGGNNTALAAKTATATIPIVFTSGIDPVAFGLVASLARPGGNITGVSWFTGDLVAKNLSLMRELLPQTRLAALLTVPADREGARNAADGRTAANRLGMGLEIYPLASAGDLDTAFAAMAARNTGFAALGTTPFFSNHRAQVVALAMRHRISTIGNDPLRAAHGLLISYGSSVADAYYAAGQQVARILAGGRPADLPVLQASRFALAINMRVAKELGIDVPASFLARVDEVIG